jgi:hypothetical protein
MYLCLDTCDNNGVLFWGFFWFVVVDRMYIQRQLGPTGVKTDIRALNLGDFVWIAQERLVLITFPDKRRILGFSDFI